MEVSRWPFGGLDGDSMLSTFGHFASSQAAFFLGAHGATRLSLKNAPEILAASLSRTICTRFARMPEETLSFPPLYCVVGAYRLLHDASLWRPMWAKCSSAAKQAGLAGMVWALLTWPIQRLFVRYFMSASASVTGFSALYTSIVHTADVTDDSLPFTIPLPSLQSKSNPTPPFKTRDRVEEMLTK